MTRVERKFETARLERFEAKLAKQIRKHNAEPTEAKGTLEERFQSAAALLEELPSYDQDHGNKLVYAGKDGVGSRKFSLTHVRVDHVSCNDTPLELMAVHSADPFTSFRRRDLLYLSAGLDWGVHTPDGRLLFEHDGATVYSHELGSPAHALNWERRMAAVENTIAVFGALLDRGAVLVS